MAIYNVTFNKGQEKRLCELSKALNCSKTETIMRAISMISALERMARQGEEHKELFVKLAEAFGVEDSQ